MFHEKEISKYQNIKAPEELKERVWLSVEKNQHCCKVKMRKAAMAVAACVTVVCIFGQVLKNDIHHKTLNYMQFLSSAFQGNF